MHPEKEQLMRKLALLLITITTLTAAQCPYERSVYSSGYDLGKKEPTSSIYMYKSFCETTCEIEASLAKKSFSSCTSLCLIGVGDGAKSTKPKIKLCK